MLISLYSVELGWLIYLRKLSICFDLPLYHLHLNILQQQEQGLESKHSVSDTRAVFGFWCGIKCQL